MLPALVIHSVPLMMLVPIESALAHTLITYIPCYIAAITLRRTMNWPMVCGFLLLQAFLVASLFQMGYPEFITEQFAEFRGLLSQYNEYQPILNSSSGSLSAFVWAQLLFGTQIASALIITIISLLFARVIQSKLFFPGGFRNELLAFRSGKMALLAFMGISLGAYYNLSLALNLLPLMVCYFLIAGFNLAYFIFARKRQRTVVILLFLLILLKPLFVLFAYVIMGSLDSIFNFRLYLPARVREST